MRTSESGTADMDYEMETKCETGDATRVESRNARNYENDGPNGTTSMVAGTGWKIIMESTENGRTGG